MEIRNSDSFVTLSSNQAKAEVDHCSLVQLPVVVVSIKNKVREYLLNQTNLVFARVDDSLFSSAENVHSQEEHNEIFQALHLLRVKRHNVTEQFLKQVSNVLNFRKCDCVVNDNSTDTVELDIVHNDEVELLVAANTIILNANSNVAKPLAVLSMGLSTLSTEKIDQDNNPFGPKAICNAFIEAVQSLDLHIHTRLILLKKFEQLVMLKLRDLYELCNKLLLDDGVLAPPLRNQRKILNSLSPARDDCSTYNSVLITTCAKSSIDDSEKITTEPELLTANLREKLEKLPESDPHWQQTFRLSQGGWFELERSKLERIRCRLTTDIQSNNQFIFTNQFGTKLFEVTRLEVAHALKCAQLIYLDNAMLFERALQSVIVSMRSKKSG